MTQQPLTQGEDGGTQTRRRSVPRTARTVSPARCGYAYSRTGSPSRIGVVGVCRLRSGHL
ncbi:putative Integral membrane protein [Streptomyces viridochromogenes Tue57]|uniref:Putative Integral membrane protein n=1 Tax=Streptomyces viridochromogenes Tue57 TaxID=1160705 RepID=L8PF46_STRVR|nr:putative Integral membrane protein [Streptomyces viridochromogenes Tue57]